MYNMYKIDYLATHNYNYDKFLYKDYVKNKIKAKLEQYKGKQYFQHKKHKEVISHIEPLLFMKEIEDKIFNTYTNVKPFNTIKPKLNKEKKVFNIVNNFFEKYGKRTKEDLFNTIKFIFDTYNELLYFRIRNNKLECAYHIYNLENKVDFFKDVKYKNKDLDKTLIEIMDGRQREYLTLRKPHYLPANNCLLGFDSYNKTLKVASVKNRFGPHTADGSDYTGLFVNYALCQISDTDALGMMYRRDAVYSDRQVQQN